MTSSTATARAGQAAAGLPRAAAPGETALRHGASRAALLFACAIACGCAVGPDYVPPEPEVPDAWHLELSRGFDEGQADLRTWWTTLDDPILDGLIERARAGNVDLRVALGRVLEARAARGVARGEWFPSVDTQGSASTNQVPESLAQLLVPDGTRTFESYQLGLDASWEIDVFGRIRRSTESAGANLMASVENYRDVLVSLYAEVAFTYVDLRALQQRVAYAVSNVENQRDTLRLTRDRNRAGLAADLDVRQAELNVAETEAVIPLLESQIAQSIHRLGVLLGQPPDVLYAELEEPRPTPDPSPKLEIGLPMDLLRQRPDVRSAERQLAAQTARIGVATADLYPRFSLVGSFALSAVDAAEFFTRGSTRYGLGPTMQWNLFSGGRVRNLIAVEDARAQQALARYEQTVLLALEDVENGIVAYELEIARRDALKRSVVAAEQSVELVKVLYRTGLTNFQNVLDMERSLFRQQDKFATSEGAVVQNLIRLYRALGGGWDPALADQQSGELVNGPGSSP